MVTFLGLCILAFSFIHMADPGENQQPEQGMSFSLVISLLCLHLHYLDLVIPLLFLWLLAIFIPAIFPILCIFSLQLLQEAITEQKHQKANSC